MGSLIPETMLKEILAFYQEVYQIKRDPGGVQCAKDVVGEAYNEILEVLKACLWCRQGSSQPEEPRWIPECKQKQSIMSAHGQPVTTSIPSEPSRQHSREEALRVPGKPTIGCWPPQQCLRDILMPPLLCLTQAMPESWAFSQSPVLREQMAHKK